MDYAHTLIKLAPGAQVAVGKSIRPGQCQLNFGEGASIPLTMAQAEATADALRAWVDERLAAAPAPTILRG